MYFTESPLVYRQYCLLPAPKHILKIIISYFPGATWFPYYISIPHLVPCLQPYSSTLIEMLPFQATGRKRMYRVVINGLSL